MLLKKLSEVSGVSGCEKKVKDIIVEHLDKKNMEYSLDSLGNLIVSKNLNKESKKLAIITHMDEIGIIVTNVTSDGLIKFTKVGNFDERILVSKEVLIGEKGTRGVIGAKPIHLQTAKERTKALKVSKLYIDIGVESKSEALKHINIGDYVSIESPFKQFSEKIIKGKALNSRACCNILLDVLNETSQSIYGVFSTMKEVGIIGGGQAIYNISPEYTIILEAIDGDLGKGPILNIKDLGTIFNRGLIDKISELASEKNISIQFSGKSDDYSSGIRVQTTGIGNKSIKIGLPCKYLRTPTNMINKDDYSNTLKLTKEIIELIGRE